MIDLAKSRPAIPVGREEIAMVLNTETAHFSGTVA